jgi:hypothetical protein
MCPLQAHCHCGLGRLYAKTDQAEQTRAELSTAIEMYLVFYAMMGYVRDGCLCPIRHKHVS